MGWDHKKKLKIRLWGRKRSSGRNTANIGGYKFKCVTSKHLEITKRNVRWKNQTGNGKTQSFCSSEISGK